MEVTPVYIDKDRMPVPEPEKAMPSDAGLKYSGYLFPQLQYEERRDEIDEQSIQ